MSGKKKQRQLNDKYSSTKKYWGDELNGFSMSGLSCQTASKNLDDLGFTHCCRNTQYRMDFSNFQPIHCYLKGPYILTSFAKLKKHKYNIWNIFVNWINKNEEQCNFTRRRDPNLDQSESIICAFIIPLHRGLA